MFSSHAFKYWLYYRDWAHQLVRELGAGCIRSIHKLLHTRNPNLHPRMHLGAQKLQREIFPWRELVKLDLGEPQRVSIRKLCLCLDLELNLAPVVGILTLCCVLPQPQDGGRKRSRGRLNCRVEFPKTHNNSAMLMQLSKLENGVEIEKVRLYLLLPLWYPFSSISSVFFDLICLPLSFPFFFLVRLLFKSVPPFLQDLPQGFELWISGHKKAWQVTKQYAQCELICGKGKVCFYLCVHRQD